jgi:hypothetical protein
MPTSVARAVAPAPSRNSMSSSRSIAWATVTTWCSSQTMPLASRRGWASTYTTQRALAATALASSLESAPKAPEVAFMAPSMRSREADAHRRFG